MTKIKGICRNEDCIKFNEEQEAEQSDFVCSECGERLLEFNPPKRGIDKRLIAIVCGVVVVLAIVGGIMLWSGGDDKVDAQQSPKEAVSDNDSLQRATIAAEQQRVKDSLQRVADSIALEVEKSRETAKQNNPKPTVEKPVKKTASIQSKNLGYAVFKGTLRNGKPDDVNGRLIFKTSHVIDSRDPKGRVAEAGDYVIREFSEVHLVQGIWYDANNTVKGSIIIGK